MRPSDADNIKSGLDFIGARVASAITPIGAPPGQDATGGHVGSLTEAVMGMTAALTQIAEALADIATAISERGAK